MKPRHAIAVTTALLLALAACGSSETEPETPTKTVTAEPEAAPEPAEDAADDTAEDAELPDLTGQTLQAAQDAAQEAGFYGLTSSDATGADRMQILDRGWQVCAQTPAAGTHPTDTIIDFSTVKVDESCP